MSSKFIKKTTVTAIDGNTYPKDKCRLIQKKYYLIGDRKRKNSGQVYFIEEAGKKGKWYRPDAGYIVFDHRQNMYVLGNSLEVIVEDGVIGIEKDGTPILGLFSQDMNNPSTTILVHNKKEYICLDDTLVKDSSIYKEAISDGKYYKRNAIPAIRFTEPATVSQEYKNSLPYDSKGITKKVAALHNELYQPQIGKYVGQFAPILDGLSFGVEFESIKGVIPKDTCDRLGLIPLRDGSIKGLEYVTVPMEGEKGIQALIDILTQLKKRTRYDNSCALHIHFGNLPRTEQFLVALFKVLFLVQDEMYDMFPFYKKQNCSIKRKHYTQPLPLQQFIKISGSQKTAKQILDAFSSLFYFLSMGQNFSGYKHDLEKVTKHPADPNGTQKWNIKTRYYWVNLIPIIFGNKQTVEFRIHTPTYDIDKVINFLFLTSSIINFTKINEKLILSDFEKFADYDLIKIFSTVGRKTIGGNKFERLHENLENYIYNRKKFFIKRLEEGNLQAEEDDLTSWGKNFKWTEKATLSTQEEKEMLSKVKSKNHYPLKQKMQQEQLLHGALEDALNALENDINAGQGWHQFENINAENIQQINVVQLNPPQGNIEIDEVIID